MASPSSTAAPLEVPSAGPGTAVNTLIGGLTALGLYGFFCALFGITIHVLCFRRKQEKINYILLVASLLIFVLTTLDVVLQCNRLLLGLLFTPPGLSPDVYFSGAGTWTYALQLSALMTNIIVADAVLLYRVWVVWGKRWPFIVVNSILWCAALGSTIRIIQLEVEGVRNPLDFANLLMLAHWAVVVPALSLGHTVLATGLIAFRLFQVERSVSAYTRTSLFPVMRIVVESGVIYTVLMLVETVTQATSSAASLLFFQLISPAIGITFALIVCRVGLGISDSAPVPRSNGPYSSKSVNVSVKRTVDTQEAYDSASVMEEGDDTMELKGLGPTGSHAMAY
ncbi:hypothetical protein CALVIDRAFT_595962 [Calocera viscosa TUFC12733]|uniref:Uncharacterized protein n=1 Tax=Calocera viscosa (strain TUFC12733) TaxID=1330018 RepID=A0A167Q2P4_CALVF|nr:hypothetical protein CALVIDRAFT_595962 [Calocera viscosa TUFC12733]